MTAPSTLVEVLARRADLLRAVRAASRSKPRLAEELGVSRSTVDRAVRELEAEGFVERADGVSLTLQGRLAVKSYEALAADLDGLDAAASVLGTLPEDARVDTALLRDAAVVEASPVAPQRATEAYRSLAADATRIRGYASTLLDSTVPTLHDQIVEAGLEMELLLGPEVLSALVGSHRRAVADARDTGRMALREVEDGLAYSLLLVETPETTYATALFYDGTAHTGLVRNDAPAAVEWAESVYEDLLAAADQLPE
ncbi:helix-turn-helix transcriptional regulator [Halobacterium jilantaiense]|uniref:Predicted transcriptional regulator, contains HTH domain n=1 Tax=Halobacterium jilantaiense TaxID=355548 RepID=A0A1I0NEL0_9EURY|nr:GntR family transcriptional regulator [Halobacterium jilantaiense]SEV99441.1 Predicted transcriptional regulator, contains HTH domain [Halobacterium jilantaiense]